MKNINWVAIVIMLFVMCVYTQLVLAADTRISKGRVVIILNKDGTQTLCLPLPGGDHLCKPL